MYKGERINSISHLTGAVMSLIGWIFLVIFASMTRETEKIISVTIYGFTLVLMYVTSTLFHSLKGDVKKVFQMLDHMSIYLLIAGTYTPFAMVVFPGEQGNRILAVVWGIAFCGIIFKSIFKDRFDFVSTLFYIAMGWLVLLDVRTLIATFDPIGVIWVGVGGALYTIGAVFYLLEKLPYNHEIWHFFVISASICHYVSVFYYVI